MTISELAKIALDEGRQMIVRRASWRPGHQLNIWGYPEDTFRTQIKELAADDWYEVKDQ